MYTGLFADVVPIFQQSCVNCHSSGKYGFINLMNLALLKLLAELPMGLAIACQQQNPRSFSI